MSTPTFPFKLASDPAFAGATAPDRVTVCLGFMGNCVVNLRMSAVDARAMANALYEAADASEKLLPVTPPEALRTEPESA